MPTILRDTVSLLGCYITFRHLCSVLTKDENAGVSTPLNIARPPCLASMALCDAEGLLKHCTMDLFQLDVNIFLASFLPSLLIYFFSVFFTTVVSICPLLICYNQVKTLTANVCIRFLLPPYTTH